MVRTSIDIGTNSVKLLIADVRGTDIFPLEEKSIQTRLGRGLYDTGRLCDQSMKDTLSAIQGFIEKSSIMGAESLRILATSAMREASNSEQFSQQIQELTGSPVEVISGQEEARLAYLGVQAQLRDPEAPVLVIDVGGGSTELILGIGPEVMNFVSLEMGSVRCYETFPISDPPTPHERAHAEQTIASQIGFLNSPGWMPGGKPVLTSISTGGTAAAMTCMAKKQSRLHRDDIDTMTLPMDTVSEINSQLWSVSLAARREIPGIPRKKADILIMGVLIHEVIFKLAGIQVCYPSTRGLRFGALLEV